MALRIRLARGGTKKRPHYNIVIADSRNPRDGRFIEKIGFYNPLLPQDHADRLKLDLEAAKAWIAKGAVASDRVHKWLADAGLVKARIHNNPQKAKPKKKAQERAAAAAKAAEAPRLTLGAGRSSGRRHRRAGPEGRGEGQDSSPPRPMPCRAMACCTPERGAS